MGTVKPKLNSYEVDFKPSSILSVCDGKGTGSNKMDKSNLKQHTSLKEIGLKIKSNDRNSICRQAEVVLSISMGRERLANKMSWVLITAHKNVSLYLNFVVKCVLSASFACPLYSKGKTFSIINVGIEI